MFRGLNCGNIGVYQDGFNARAFQGFYGLAAGIIEFTSFTNF